MNVPQLLQEAVEGNPEADFLFFRDRVFTYRAFAEMVARVAAGMVDGGVEPGDRVALALGNRPELLVSWFAAARIGAIEVPLNPSLTERELHFVLEDSGAKWAIAEPAAAARCRRLEGAGRSLERVIPLGALGDERGGEEWARLGAGRERRSPLPEPPQAEVPLAILYTSGTTGAPKGVVLSHESGVLTGQCTAYMLGSGPASRIATPNPLFHVNAQFHGALTAVAARSGFVLLERFSRSRLLEQVAHYSADVLLLAAAAVTMLGTREPDGNDDQTGVRTLLTGGVPQADYRSFERRFGLRVQTAYASTETPVAIMAPREEAARRPTPGIGVPMAHPEPGFDNVVEVVDEEGRPLPAGRTGELVVRNRAVTSGYWDGAGSRPPAPRTEGWHTGDLGYRDEDGYFYFVGRTKDVIRRRGEMVAPAEIERILGEHTDVEECAVVGAPSELGVGESEIVGYVVLRDGARADAAALAVWCGERLAPYKIPREFRFRDRLPKTSLGKIRKSDLLGSAESTTAVNDA